MRTREHLRRIGSLTDAFDREHLWHPYTSALDPLPALRVKRAYGRTIELADGEKLLDAMSSWWCCVHGYGVQEITEAVQRQAAELSHVMFAGFTHDPAIELGKKLLSLMPKQLEHVFYADSGSVATEVAMKMAVQYQKALGRDRKTSFVTIRSGYHGDTWNAMSVCDPAGMHTLFGEHLPKRMFAENPKSPYPGSIIKADPETKERSDRAEFDPTDLDDIRRIMEEHGSELAAVILEPVVQGAGGMFFYHPKFLTLLRELCDEHDMLLIFDEIATGFGRTGRDFALEHCDAVPDIVLLGKGLTGGYMTLSAVLCTHETARAVSEGAPHVFMHGPTFMANPLACAAACASIDVFRSYDAAGNARRIERQFKAILSECAELESVVGIRALGAIGVIEMRDRIDPEAAEVMSLETGVWLRPMGRLLYAMPPLTSTEHEVSRMARAMLLTAKMHDQGELTTGKIRDLHDSLI